ncbi:hypothetical protein C8R46DRAFT_284455 [Mycena filopes]|nr:hypothetical protein C8R46DRAFT_284455 [Mycena filopes]
MLSSTSSSKGLLVRLGGMPAVDVGHIDLNTCTAYSHGPARDFGGRRRKLERDCDGEDGFWGIMVKVCTSGRRPCSFLSLKRVRLSVSSSSRSWSPSPSTTSMPTGPGIDASAIHTGPSSKSETADIGKCACSPSKTPQPILWIACRLVNNTRHIRPSSPRFLRFPSVSGKSLRNFQPREFPPREAPAGRRGQFDSSRAAESASAAPVSCLICEYMLLWSLVPRTALLSLATHQANLWLLPRTNIRSLRASSPFLAPALASCDTQSARLAENSRGLSLDRSLNGKATRYALAQPSRLAKTSNRRRIRAGFALNPSSPQCRSLRSGGESSRTRSPEHLVQREAAQPRDWAWGGFCGSSSAGMEIGWAFGTRARFGRIECRRRGRKEPV